MPKIKERKSVPSFSREGSGVSKNRVPMPKIKERTPLPSFLREGSGVSNNREVGKNNF